MAEMERNPTEKRVSERKRGKKRNWKGKENVLVTVSNTLFADYNVCTVCCITETLIVDASYF